MKRLSHSHGVFSVPAVIGDIVPADARREYWERQVEESHHEPDPWAGITPEMALRAEEE